MSVTCGRSVVFSVIPFSSTNKTDRHDVTERLLKVALNTIAITPHTSFSGWYESLSYLLHRMAENLLIWIRVRIFYKLLHHILSNNKLLHKMGIKNSALCNFCNQEEDFILHYLWDCPVAKRFWTSFNIWLSSALDLEVFELTPKKTVLGIFFRWKLLAKNCSIFIPCGKKLYSLL